MRSAQYRPSAAAPASGIGCSLLFCLVNPYGIPHDRVMQSIELLGEKVIPELT